MVYRNDDGVDASTLPPILDPDQRKGGHVFCPGFFPHLVANRPECSYKQGEAWHSILSALVSTAGASRWRITRRALPVLQAETAWLCGFGAASLQRLRSGSDAADVIGFPPFRVIVETDDDRHCAIVIAFRRKLGFVAEHIVQTATQRIGDTMSDFQGRHALTAFDGVQRLPADC